MNLVQLILILQALLMIRMLLKAMISDVNIDNLRGQK